MDSSPGYYIEGNQGSKTRIHIAFLTISTKFTLEAVIANEDIVIYRVYFER